MTLFPPLALRHRLGGYHEYGAPPALVHVSEAVWIYRTPQTIGAGGLAAHRVLPDPSLGIAFCCVRDAHGRALDPRLLVVGPKTRPHACTFARGFEMVAVRMKLEWSATVLGVVPADHSDALDDLSLVRPRVAAPLLDLLAETHTAGEAAAALAEALGRFAQRAPARRPETAARALDLVRHSGGHVPVEQVAGRMGVSVRHLRRVVRRDAGMSLKGYARTVRLLRAVTAADRTPRPAWARIAAESGYCDQSHLVRECRAMCGLAPSQVYRERRAEDRFIQSPAAAVA